MIAGEIDPPNFSIDNERILRRQIHSLVLEKLDFQFHASLQDHIPEGDAEIDFPELDAELNRRRDEIVEAVLKAFNKDRQAAEKRDSLAWLNQREIGAILDGYYAKLMQAFEPWKLEQDALYQQILDVEMEVGRIRRRNPQQAAALSKEIEHLYRLLAEINKQYTLSYLSDQGFLPSYAFPADGARLIAKDQARQPLLRAMGIALREYAPGNTVYMDGSKYQVIGLDFHRSPIPDLHKSYRRCEQCDYVTFETGQTLCPHCRRDLMPLDMPMLFALSFVAERASSISADEEYRQRAYYAVHTYFLGASTDGDRAEIAGVSAIYHRRGDILTVNTGLLKDEGAGFLLCRQCGYWHAPGNKKPFEDHKLLHNRRQVCGGNSERYHLGYQFHTDVLILRFQDVPDPSPEFYASLKAALIEAATSIVGAEQGEIGGFTRIVQNDEGQMRADLLLYDSVPGGAGHVKKAMTALETMLAAARTLLEGCACDKSCYKCLRSYGNQFEHQLLDKRLIQPYLDHLIALNSEQERSRLAQYNAGSRRFCGQHAAAWLQRKCQDAGGPIVAVCTHVLDDTHHQTASWATFFVDYVRQHPGMPVTLGLTNPPTYTAISEENFLAVKTLFDLLQQGVRLVQLPESPSIRWHLATGTGSGECLTVATLGGLPAFSPAFGRQALVYNTQADVCRSAFEQLTALLEQGDPITASSLNAPREESYRIETIREGERGKTYAALFGPYLNTAQWVRITDPYIRQGFQFNNLENLLALVQDGSTVEVVTMYQRNNQYGMSGETISRQNFDQITADLAQRHIQFSYRFDPTLHDRHIETPEWQIILGRGLDFFHPPESGYPLGQQHQRTRACHIIYLART